MRTQTVAALGVACLVTLSARATAQNMQFMSGPTPGMVTAFGYYLSPYSGTFLSDPTKPTISLFCLDVANEVTWGQKWTANFTNLGLTADLSNTRRGNAFSTQYKEAAWLTTQFDPTKTFEYAGLQSAIWQLFNPGLPNGGNNVNDPSQEAYWLARGNQFVTSGAINSFDFSDFAVVTDVNAKGLQYGGVQEFITTYTTPEPSALVLLATGMFGMVGFARTRRSRA